MLDRRERIGRTTTYMWLICPTTTVRVVRHELPSHVVFHANLSLFENAEVRQLFSPYGDIVQCRLIGNRGVAFVLYDLQQQAQSAIDNLNGITLPESANPLSVKVASDANSHKVRRETHALQLTCLSFSLLAFISLSLSLSLFSFTLTSLISTSSTIQPT
jgi:hypothetical protein